MTHIDVSRARATADAEARFVMDEEAFRGFYDRNARGVVGLSVACDWRPAACR